MTARWLKHSADLRSVSVVLLTFAFQLYVLSLDLGALSPWAIVGTAAVLAYLCSVCMVINHNHIHIPFFRAETANKIFSILISVAEGLSSKFLIVPHNFNHHVHGGTVDDWCYEGNAGKGLGVVRMIRYIGVTWGRMMGARFSGAGPQLPARFRKQELIEHSAIFAFTVGALAFNLWAFLAFIFPAWLVAAGFITLTNLIQHEECETEDDFAHSRNYVGKLGNWLLFNAGYHTAHHMKPALHWTELPRYHREIESRIPARLNEPSLLWYLVREYALK